MKPTLFCVPLLLAAALGGAEPLSRAQAVARALEKNPDILRSVAENDRLNGRAREARADALPELALHGSFQRYVDPGFLNSPNIGQFPPELIQAFRPLPSNLWGSSLSVRQTLWSFSLNKAVRAAGYATALGKENLERVRQDVALRAILAYNAYLVALERVKVSQTLVHQKEQQLDMARNRRRNGVATEVEVLRFEVDLANAGADLLRLQGAAELARGDLNAVMVRPTDTPVEPTDSLVFVDVPAEQPAVRGEALLHRSELRAIGWSEKIYDEAVGIYKADMQPRLDFNGAFGWAVRLPENFFRDNYRTWAFSVSLKVPVFDGWRTAGRVAQAQADRAKVGQDRVALETEIDVEAKQAVDRLRVARSVLRAAEMNVVQARRALEMIEANYKLGAATSLDVLDAQAASAQAEVNRIEALYAHANARAGLRYVMGQDPLDETAPPPSPAGPGPATPSPSTDSLPQQAPVPAATAPALVIPGRDPKDS
ncbi:MAG TPA: TolC family protein [Vicinamibacteria bacterium]|nr:TolC family protein [Vicinamibacteria bacterium]